MVVTKREIVASVSIIAVLLILGFLISGKINENQIDKNEIYNKAVKIKETDTFEYGMRTNVGNAFVYGELKAVDPVTYPEIGGKYMYVKKVREVYTMHTRTVTHTRPDGSTYTTLETYWSWDYDGSEKIASKKLSFLGVVFDSKKINIPGTKYIDTIRESGRVRYVYYGTKAKFQGTIFTELKNDTITDNTKFYELNIEETMEKLQSNSTVLITLFWVLWIGTIIGCVVAFYYFENRWLE